MKRGTQWPRATLLALCAALPACPTRVTPQSDAALEASSDAEISDVFQDESHPSLDVTLTVALGPFVPESAGEGWSVLAQSSTGSRVEASTNSEGRATLSLDARQAPWDLTVARVGYLAVSIMDVREGFSSTVYTQRMIARRESQRPRAINATFRNAADTSVVSLVSRSLINSELAHEPDWTLEQMDDVRVGIGPQRFWAIEWRSDGSGFPLRPLRAVRLDEVPADRPGPLNFDVDLSTATVMPAESTVQVELPSTGIVTRESVRLGAPTRVQFAFVDEVGARYASYSVGSVSAEYVRSANGPTITIAHLAGELSPVTGSVTYPSADGAQSFELQLWPTGTGGASTLRVPPVERVSASGSTLSEARFEAAASGYHPGFAVLGGDGQSVGWVGFSQGGRAIARRALPALPTGFSLAAHLLTDNARLIATLTHRAVNDAAPWEPGATRTLDVEVDSAFITIPSQ
ncbi:MAG: hypothetical protein U0269_15555 [Polyangiales bacterium]